jgi:hypothetical protein
MRRILEGRERSEEENRRDGRGYWDQSIVKEE